MSSRRSVLLLVVALAVGNSTAAADTLPCSQSPVILPAGYTNTQGLVVLLDGKVSATSEVPGEEIERVIIMCWDPKTGDFVVNDVMTVEGTVPVMVFMTKEVASSDE